MSVPDPLTDRNFVEFSDQDTTSFNNGETYWAIYQWIGFKIKFQESYLSLGKVEWLLSYWNSGGNTAHIISFYFKILLLKFEPTAVYIQSIISHLCKQKKRMKLFLLSLDYYYKRYSSSTGIDNFQSRRVCCGTTLRHSQLLIS